MKRYWWANPVSLSLLLTGVIICSYITGNRFLDVMELKAFDLRFRTRGNTPPGPFVALATIDEKSLDEIGRWPWPRAKIAALIERLSEMGARVIAMDIGFSEPDANTALIFIGQLQQEMRKLGVTSQALERFMVQAREQADNDAILAAAVRHSRASVVLGYFFHFSQKEIAHLSKEERAHKAANLGASEINHVRFTSRGAQNVRVFEAVLPESNIARLSQASPMAGYYNIFPDVDGTIRWGPLIIRYQDRFFPSLEVLLL